MARALTFRHGGAELAFGLEKIDRKKLYGYIEPEVQDSTGQPCELLMLGSDGRTLVGRGGSSLLMLDADGKYATRGELRPVTVGGDPVTRVPSSFDAPIDLSTPATVDALLAHNIKAAYALTPPMGATDLLRVLRQCAIFTFPFSYRGGLDPDVAFLLVNSDGAPFLLLGKPTHLEFVSLSQIADPEEDEAPDSADGDDDDMDFAMM